MSKPIVYVIAGPNGAGKTTFAKEFLPTVAGCFEFVNADSMALGLSPLAPERVALEAGKLVLRRIRTLADGRQSFGFETTLAGRTYVRLLRDLRNAGYEVHLYFLWLRSVDLALHRVAERVRQSGHNIPEADVRRRYAAGLRNMALLYRPLTDYVALLDNSDDAPRLIVDGNGQEIDAAVSRLASGVGQPCANRIAGAQE